MPSGVYTRTPWMGNYPGVEQRRRSIIRRYAQGSTLEEIARRFVLSVDAVQDIVFPGGVQAVIHTRKYSMLTRDAKARGRKRKCVNSE